MARLEFEPPLRRGSNNARPPKVTEHRGRRSRSRCREKPKVKDYRKWLNTETESLDVIAEKNEDS